MFSPVPPLFATIPAGLFSPLAGALAPLYWSVLARLYQIEFEGEPQYVVRETAQELVAQVVRESPLWTERRDELAQSLADDGGDGDGPGDGAGAPGADDDAERAAARRLVARLERAGWFHFEYRSTIGHVLSFHPHAARLLETLVRVARDEQPLFQGFAHAIAALLRPESVAARPGVALREARRHTLELMRELKILERNIFAFTQRLVERAASAAEVLEEGLERYRSAVQANYHRLKTVDNLYKWRGEIMARVDTFERDSLALGGAAAWYAEQDGVDRASGAARVGDDLRLLRAQFDALPRLIDEIDERNARFSGVALRKLMYLLRHDRRLEGQLQGVVDALAQDRGPELELDVFECQLLGDGFLFTAPKRRARPARDKLKRPPRGDAAILKAEVAERLRRRFSRPRVEALAASLLAGRTQAPIADLPLESDEDYVRAIYLVAFGLDLGSDYRFERPADRRQRIEKDGYGMPAGTLARRRR
jgi:hypothetical protein